MKATCERAIEGKAAWPKVGRSATMLVAKHKPLLLHNHHFAEGLSTTLVKKKVQLRLQQEGSCRSISGGLSTAVGCTASRPASRLQLEKPEKRGLLPHSFLSLPAWTSLPRFRQLPARCSTRCARRLTSLATWVLGGASSAGRHTPLCGPPNSAQGCTGTSRHFGKVPRRDFAAAWLLAPTHTPRAQTR